MELSYVLLMSLGGILLLSGICWGYLVIYRQHINRALAEPGKKHIRLVDPHILLLALVLAAAMLVISLLIVPPRATTIHQLEADIRDSQQLPEDWQVEIAEDSRLAASLAYDPQKTEHAFSLYKIDGSGYVFRYGGKSTSIQRGVRVFHHEGSMALLSMNALEIAAIETGDGLRYALDPGLPFVLILPDGVFTAYDRSGAPIDIAQEPWYEVTPIP